MNKFEKIKEWLDLGHEIEFTYKNKQYSVTYFINELNQEKISFCEFYKEPTDFETQQDFMENAKIDGEYLKEIWDKVVDIYIY